MAYQLQTLPGQFKPKNPTEQLMGGIESGQKLYTNLLKQETERLSQEEKRIQNKYLDDELFIAMKQSLADLGLTQAQTQSVQSSADLNSLRAELDRKYGGQKYQAEIDAIKALEQQRLREPQMGTNNLWRSLPPADREHYGAIGRALGYDTSAMARMINEGMNLEQIAALKDVNPEELKELTPQYLATAPTRTATQKRLAAESEIEYLTPKVTEAISKYINPYNIAGYSPEQIWDTVSGQNVDKQAEFMAANMIWPEIIYNRLRLANAETGVTAFEHMQNVTPTFVRQFSGVMRPEVFMKAQEKANKWLSEASRHAAKVSLNPSEYFKGEISKEDGDMVDNDPLGIR